MNTTAEIISGLESGDAAIRNASAIRMINENAVNAMNALAVAIEKPANIGANGTLVYALGHFNFQPYVDLLVKVAVQHGYEASQTAMMILLDNPTHFAADQVGRINNFLRSVNSDSMTDYQQESLVELMEYFRVT